MRWLFCILLLIPLSAQAVWYQFRPCGFTAGIDEKGEIEPVYAYAPNLTILFWRIPMTAVIQVVGIPPTRDGIECSWLAVNGDQWLVVGSPEQIYDTLLGRRRAEFKDYQRKQ